jgi:hypothetical protein
MESMQEKRKTRNQNMQHPLVLYPPSLMDSLTTHT